MNSFDSTCLNVNTATSPCDTATQAGVSTTCYQCLVSAPTDSTWGVLIDEPQFWELDMGGCYAAEAAGEVTCGQDTQYQLECELAECNGGGSSATFSTCKTTADKSPSGKCACFATNATTDCASYSSTSQCNPLNGTSFDSTFKAYAKIMCQ